MVDTAGKKLKQARLRKQLSLEEVARTTKIRVPRLQDLENDDYTNFPSMAYVRGFLFIYAKYLGTDVSEYTEALAAPAPSVGIGDYEYLSNAPDRSDAVIHRKQLKRSIWPLLVLGILLGVGAFAALITYFVVSAQRLGNLDELAQKHIAERSGVPYQSKPEKAETPKPPAVPSSQLPAPTPAEPEIRKAQAVEQPAAPPVATPVADLTPKEVVVKALKKTWVKIYNDSPDSPPIYEDWLYPDTLPLKLRGTRFVIQMSDPTGLQILKNGISQPIDQPSITIQ